MSLTTAVSKVGPAAMRRAQAYTLYACHALSTWNARSYEFAAVLFTAVAYPDGLRAASFIGISTSLAAICFGSTIGRWIDSSPSRLRTLLVTIVLNRIAIISACIFWALIVSDTNPSSRNNQPSSEEGFVSTAILQGIPKTITFLFLLGLGIIESLSRKANLMSIERDWVPVLASPCAENYSLSEVNATMARIDMVCKLIAPISISAVVSAMTSVKLVISILAMVNAVSLGFECLSARRLWEISPCLREPKDALFGNENMSSKNHAAGPNLIVQVIAWGSAYIDSIRLYFASDVWAPSLSMCMTQMSILSVTSVTVVFLLESGYSLRLVTIGQTTSAVFELSSTFITPMVTRRAMRQIQEPDTVGLVASNQDGDGEDDGEKLAPEHVAATLDDAITHLGVWGIVGMVLILAPTVPIFLFLASHLTYPISQNPSYSPTMTNYPFLTLLLFLCLSASRLGRGIFALVSLQLAQSRVPPQQRSSFAGVEQGFVSTFGLGHNLGTAIWSKPGDFGWLALGSFVALAGSSSLYGSWARRKKWRIAYRAVDDE